MHARRYETLILLSPNLGKPELDVFKDKIDNIIAQGQGKIVRFEDWGRRRLAYPVNKEIYGTYFLYDFQGQPALASELVRNLKIDEQVFKYLTLILEKEFSDERFEEVIAQQAKDAQTAVKPDQDMPSDIPAEYLDSIVSAKPAELAKPAEPAVPAVPAEPADPALETDSVGVPQEELQSNPNTSEY
jgi:small subunit ribosomal protein S6